MRGIMKVFVPSLQRRNRRNSQQFSTSRIGNVENEPEFFPLAAVGMNPHPTEKGKWDVQKYREKITHVPPGPVREGGRDFRTGRPDELTRWARAVWLLEQVPLPEAGTISGDILKAPGFLKGPAGPLSRAPRLGSSGDFFGSFLVGQKGTLRGSANLPGSRFTPV